MKKHILKLAVCALWSMSLFCSCDTDVEGSLYEVGKTEYAFASTFQKTELVPSDGNKFIVPVYRNTKNGSSTLNVSMGEVSENAEGVFTLDTPAVTFEDGKSTAEVVVSYEDIDQLGATEIYELTLSFAETQASPSKAYSVKVSAQRKLTFRKIGKGAFVSGFFTTMLGTPYLKDVVVEKAEEADIYHLLDVYVEEYPFVFSLDKNGEVVPFEQQETGYVHPVYGMICVDFVEAKKEGNTCSFTMDFVVPGVGSFGVFTETVQIPE